MAPIKAALHSDNLQQYESFLYFRVSHGMGDWNVFANNLIMSHEVATCIEMSPCGDKNIVPYIRQRYTVIKKSRIHSSHTSVGHGLMLPSLP